MSIPLPYGPPRTGVERPPPVKGPKPYAERLKQADELVEETTSDPRSLRTSFPLVCSVLMVVAAVAPVAYAPPVFREVFFGPLVRSTYPLSAGLVLAADFFLEGWAGAILLSIAAGAGLVAASVAIERRGWAASRPGAAVILLALGAVIIACAAAFAFVGVGSLAAAAGAMWIVLTGACGVYGARLAARKESWQGSVGAAVALFAGGRFFLASAVLLLLVLCDKEFPGQTVALYPWRRSQVAIEPPEPTPTVETVPFNEGEFRTHRPGLRAHPVIPNLPFLTGLFAIIGAGLPIAYSPWWRAAFFEPLVVALYPLTTFVPVTSDFLWTSALGLVWVGATTVGALYCSRFAFSATRRGGAAAAGVLLIIGGRPLLGAAVLVLVLASWDLYGRPRPVHTEAAEPAAAAH